MLKDLIITEYTKSSKTKEMGLSDFPFTPLSDGELIVRGSGTDALSYLYIKENGIYLGGCAYNTGGGLMSLTVPVTSGRSYSIMTNNLSSIWGLYKKFAGGGVL